MERKKVDRGGLRSGLFQAQSLSDYDSPTENFHRLPRDVTVPSVDQVSLDE